MPQDSHQAELSDRAWLPPLQGAVTNERVPQEALVQTGVSLCSAVGGEPQQQTALYASLDDARAGAVTLSGAAARSATEGFASAVRLQQMMNQVGPAPPLMCGGVPLPLADCCTVVMPTMCPTPAAIRQGT